jgi:hypothetical protein
VLGAINVSVAKALVPQQAAQTLVFFENFSGGGLYLLRSLCSNGLTRPVLGLKLLQILLATSARSSLVVTEGTQN